MFFDGASLLASILLILAASLASCAVWRSARSGRIFERFGLGMGAVLLLSAATFLVVAFVLDALTRSLPTFTDLTRIVSGQAVTPAIGKVEAAPHPTDDTSVRDLTSSSSRPSLRVDDRDSSAGPREEQERDEFDSVAPGQPVRAEELRIDPLTMHLIQSDPWLASRCVVATDVDWADGRRWTFENECPVPVGIVIATCASNDAACASSQAARWRYEPHGRVLPAKFQRPVTDVEQTVAGMRVRYAACYIADERLAHLIGAGIEERSSDAWHEEFKQFRTTDRCLTQVESASMEGARDGHWIELPQWRQPEP